jgi:DNA-binding CsgD family transcriptional regulator
MKRELIDWYISEKIYNRIAKEPSVAQLVAVTEACGVKVIKETPEQLRAWVSKIKCFSQTTPKVATHYNPCNITKEELQRMYWEQGLSAIEIAEEFNTTQNKIAWKMIKWNIPRRDLSNAHTKKEIDIEEFKSLYKGGYTLQQLADHFGICVKTVNKVFERNNIEKRGKCIA